MKLYIKFLFVIVVMLALASCQDYNALVKNPNQPTNAAPSLILTGIINTMNNENAWNGFVGSMSASQYWISSYTYYGSNNYDQSPFMNINFNYYSTLENIQQMEIESKNSGAADVNPYSALGKFFRAFYYHLMTQKFGDIPMSQALQGSTNTAPVYDSQKSIYVQILKWLDEANNDLNTLIANNDQTLSGSIFLGNDLKAWQKVVNTFTLRVLVSLSKKSNDADLKVNATFANILNNPNQYPILTSNSDNLQYVYNSQFNNYPKNPGNRGFTSGREVVSATILNATTALNDPRTYIFATPAPLQLSNTIMKVISGGTSTATATTKPAHSFSSNQKITISGASVSGYNGTGLTIQVTSDTTFTYTVTSGLADLPRQPKVNGSDVPVAKTSKNFADITAYVGGSPGSDMSTLGTYSQAGGYSWVNALRYYSTYDGSKAEPAIIIGYPEMCFNIAEGINQGWAAGSAATWYTNGIKASMSFLGITEGGTITVGDNVLNVYGTVTTSINAYLVQSSVQYQGDNATGLNQILTQKYIAFWQNSNWEAFFNQRRTGVPTFLTGTGTGNNGKVPIRWVYPIPEQSANATNYKAAVQSQYGGVDDLNGKMWVLQ